MLIEWMIIIGYYTQHKWDCSDHKVLTFKYPADNITSLEGQASGRSSKTSCLSKGGKKRERQRCKLPEALMDPLMWWCFWYQGSPGELSADPETPKTRWGSWHRIKTDTGLTQETQVSTHVVHDVVEDKVMKTGESH